MGNGSLGGFRELTGNLPLMTIVSVSRGFILQLNFDPPTDSQARDEKAIAQVNPLSKILSTLACRRLQP